MNEIKVRNEIVLLSINIKKLFKDIDELKKGLWMLEQQNREEVVPHFRLRRKSYLRTIRLKDKKVQRLMNRRSKLNLKLIGV